MAAPREDAYSRLFQPVLPMTYMGMPVHVSPLLGPRSVPRRVYVSRKWMTAAHHARIQKKWNKRFGTDLRDEILMFQGRCLVSAQTMAKIQSDCVKLRAQ